MCEGGHVCVGGLQHSYHQSVMMPVFIPGSEPRPPGTCRTPGASWKVVLVRAIQHLMKTQAAPATPYPPCKHPHSCQPLPASVQQQVNLSAPTGRSGRWLHSSDRRPFLSGTDEQRESFGRLYGCLITGTLSKNHSPGFCFVLPTAFSGEPETKMDQKKLSFGGAVVQNKLWHKMGRLWCRGRAANFYREDHSFGPHLSRCAKDTRHEKDSEPHIRPG